MRLTRRGRVVTGVVVIGFVWGSIFGIQALSALVLSGTIALAGSGMILRRADEPRLRRRPISADFAGEPRDVVLTVSVSPSLTATVVESVPEALRTVESTHRHPVTGRTAAYTVVAEERGVHRLGPATIQVSDPLGLVVTETETTDTQTLLTFPRVSPLTNVERPAEALLEGTPTKDRHEFDQLREYRRGDAVRDIDWKSSAKRAADPLVVKEFVSESAEGSAEIIATTDGYGTDAMARAAASVAVHLLDRGIPVGLRTADEHILPAAGTNHRQTVLTALARTGGGAVDPDHREGASIRVEASTNGDVTVTMGTRRQPFDRLTGKHAATVATDGGRET